MININDDKKEKPQRGNPLLNSDDFNAAHITKDLEYMKLYVSQLDFFEQCIKEGAELTKKLKAGSIKHISPESMVLIHDAFEDAFKQIDTALKIEPVISRENLQSNMEKIRKFNKENQSKNKP